MCAKSNSGFYVIAILFVNTFDHYKIQNGGNKHGVQKGNSEGLPELREVWPLHEEVFQGWQLCCPEAFVP